MAIYAGTALPPGFAVGEAEVTGIAVGDSVEWVPEAGSAAVDLFFGAPVQTINPDAVTVQLHAAGTPFPTTITMTSDRGRDQSAYLQGLLAGQDSGRAVVTVRILQDGQAAGVETWTVLGWNGRTSDTATLAVTWQPR